MRSIRCLSILIFFAVSAVSAAPGINPSGAKKRTYEAYVKGDPKLWESVINDLSIEYSETGDTATLRSLLYAEYAYIAFCVKEKMKNRAGDLLIDATDHLESLRIYYPGSRELTGMEAAFAGFELSIYPLKAIFLASKAKSLTEEAYVEGTTNIMCISVRANQLNFTPLAFGGDPVEAEGYYLRIIDLYDREVVAPDDDWRYVNTMVILAGVYEEAGRYTEALALYEKIMRFDPSIPWVKEGLYKNCLEKSENTTGRAG